MLTYMDIGNMAPLQLHNAFVLGGEGNEPEYLLSYKGLEKNLWTEGFYLPSLNFMLLVANLASTKL